MVRVNVQAIYFANVHTADCTTGAAWSVEKGWTLDVAGLSGQTLARSIVVTDTGAYVSSELLQVLHFVDKGINAASYSSRYLQVGRRKLYRLNAALVEACLEHICYARRSAREQQVADRNEQALTWMVDTLPIA